MAAITLASIKRTFPDLTSTALTTFLQTSILVNSYICPFHLKLGYESLSDTTKHASKLSCPAFQLFCFVPGEFSHLSSFLVKLQPQTEHIQGNTN